MCIHRYVLVMLVWLCSHLCIANESLTINGAANFSNLRTTYYTGAIVLTQNETDAQAILSADNSQQLVLRIREEWSPRRFKTLWNDALLLNNDHTELAKHQQAVQAFLGLPAAYLLPGDEIRIHYDGNHTVAAINGTPALTHTGKFLFNAIARTWIGTKPPNSQFRAAMLGLRDSREAQVIFDSLRYSAIRAQVTKRWYIIEPEPVHVTAAPPTPTTSKDVSIASRKTTIAKPTQAVASKPTPVATQKTSEAAAHHKVKNVSQTTSKADIGIAPQTASTDAKEQKTLLTQYQQRVAAAIFANARYPRKTEIARAGDGLVSQMKPEGTVIFHLQVNRAGNVLDLREIQAAEAEILNKMALQALQKTPLPPPSNTLKGALFQIPISLRFERNRVFQGSK